MYPLLRVCPVTFIIAVVVSCFASKGYCQHVTEDCSKPMIIDVYAGEPVSWETMLDDVAAARVVYLGELHSIRHHHEFQLMMLRGLFHKGHKIVLGMEMFAAYQQEILDRWLASNNTISGLGQQLGKEKWNNLSDYESLLLFAREKGVRIVGLNASGDLVRMVARGQVSALTAEQQKGFPAEDLLEPSPLYDKLLRLKLRVHKAFQGKSLDGVVRAQLVRDSVMAETVVRSLESSADKDLKFICIAGSGHLNYGFGIPERVNKKISVTDRIILPTESGRLILSDEEIRQAVPVEITHEDLRFIGKPIADYLYVFPLSVSERKGETN